MERNPNHVVSSSPWPILVALSLPQFLLSLLSYFETTSYAFLLFSLAQLSLHIGNWFYTIMIEATFEGNHTMKIQNNIKFGMMLFMISEAVFFASFFVSFFYFSISPSVWMGCVWPPAGIQTIDKFGLPLFNTALLIYSGLSLTWAHKLMLAGDLLQFKLAMFITMFTGFVFLIVQYFEYNYAQFSITDSVYGSIFYLLTGFHGLHVIIGLIFLIVCLMRAFHYHFTKDHHVGFICASWYWHFVDGVWILLYLFVYCWGNN